jgi:hypothetical protein
VNQLGKQVFDENYGFNAQAEITSGSGTGTINLIANVPTDVRIEQITATNSDSIDHVLDVLVNIGGSYKQLGSVNVPAAAGYGLTPNVDVLAAILKGNYTSMLLIAYNNMGVASEDVVTSPETMVVTLFGGLV